MSQVNVITIGQRMTTMDCAKGLVVFLGEKDYDLGLEWRVPERTFLALQKF